MSRMKQTHPADAWAQDYARRMADVPALPSPVDDPSIMDPPASCPTEQPYTGPDRREQPIRHPDGTVYIPRRWGWRPGDQVERR